MNSFDGSSKVIFDFWIIMGNNNQLIGKLFINMVFCIQVCVWYILDINGLGYGGGYLVKEIYGV